MPWTTIKTLKDQLKHEIASCIKKVDALIGYEHDTPGFFLPVDMGYEVRMYHTRRPWEMKYCQIRTIAIEGFSDEVNKRWPKIVLTGAPDDEPRSLNYGVGDIGGCPDLDVESYAYVYGLFKQWFSPDDWMHLLDKIVSINKIARMKR